MNHYEIINEYNGKVKYDFLPKIIDKCLEIEHVENAIFSIIFIDDEKMHELNKTYRGIDRTTDVLSLLMKIMKQLSVITECLEKYL